MKLLLLILCLVLTLSGCAGTPDETMPSTTNTQPSGTQATQSTQPTRDPTESTGAQEASQAVGILQQIWAQVPEGSRFSAYGGTVEHAAEDAPGDLDLQNTEELTTKYMVPPALLEQISEGASLVHLMNSNIFTGAAFQLSGDVAAAAKALRDNIQNTQWICGHPDKLLIAGVQEHLLMAYGEQELMGAFQTALTAAFPDAQLLYNEAVTE